ncbi:MAG: mechanosensitive ion channel [bacterium]
MEWIQRLPGVLVGMLADLAPPAGVLVLVVLTIYAANRYLGERQAASEGRRYRMQLINAGIGLLGLLAFVLVLPVKSSIQGQLLSLIGIIVSAAIALSSTTVLGNAMAGFMLRVVKGFGMGDFVSVEDHFGRVSERGLFHTEIQTEQREFTTLPNLYLVQNPVTVVRSSGTAISCRVSLGYDVPRGRVEELLKEAARGAGLEDPFVHVMELCDFSVTYRVSGLLSEVKELITARSRLRSAVMDSLHAGRVEIVSPAFTNRRTVDEETFIPEVEEHEETAEEGAEEKQAEDLVFDKAEEAESREERMRILKERLEEIQGELEEGAEEGREEQLEAEKERIKERLEVLVAEVEEAKEEEEEG